MGDCNMGALAVLPRSGRSRDSPRGRDLPNRPRLFSPCTMPAYPKCHHIVGTFWLLFNADPFRIGQPLT